jgi:ABC-type phosphate/phosphonate transport system permease subunit
MNKFKEAIVKANDIVLNNLMESYSTKNEVFGFFATHRKKLTVAGYGLFALMLGFMFSFGFSEAVLATDPGVQVFQRANTAMQGVLRQVRLISSIIAALFLTLAFLMKMFSKNQRTVDEANTWIKRIAIAWACINAVGFILSFIQEIIGPDVDLPTIGS